MRRISGGRRVCEKGLVRGDRGRNARRSAASGYDCGTAGALRDSRCM